MDWKNRILRLDNLTASELQDHAGNWRLHPKHQADALAGVLSEVGIVDALLVYESDRQGGLTVIDGHLRKQLDPDTKWPCLVTDLTDAEADLVLATFDWLTYQAAAEESQLAALLESVQTENLAVQELLDSLATEFITPIEDEDHNDLREPEITDAEKVQQKWQVQRGDIWECGRHVVTCGDCLDRAFVEKVLKGMSPTCIWADPPYGISIVATNGYVGGGEAYDIPFGGQKKRKGYVGGGQREKDLTGLDTIQRPLGTVGGAKPFGSSRHERGSVGASNMVAVGKYFPVEGDETTETAKRSSGWYLSQFPSAWQCWWGGNYYTDVLPPSSCWIVWDKDNTGNFADCELAWTNMPKATRLFRHRWNGLLKASEQGQRRVHPTQKPVALAAWAFETFGTSSDLILDPFLGSGISVLAAEQLQDKRSVIGIDIVPEYIAVTLERWHQLTGQEPIRRS